MRTINKHQLGGVPQRHAGEKVIMVGIDPKLWNIDPRAAQMARALPCIWVQFDPLEEPREYEYEIFGTTGNIPDGYEHVGSVVHHQYVWHVYRILVS